jgi:hypothetical protein
MNDDLHSEMVIFRLRHFLLALSACLLVGTLVELWFTNHMEEPVQLIPFFLSGLGILTAGAALIRPARGVLRTLRASMGLVAIGSLFGMYEHIANNVAFQLEIQSGLTGFEKLSAGLGGANPLLAPGILGIAALLSIAATYGHPALVARKRNREDKSFTLIGRTETRLEK